MQSSGIPLALPPSIGDWLLISQACGWGVCVCVCICIYRGTVDRGSGRCASHSTFVICPLLRVERTPWVLGCSFIEARLSVTSIAMSQSTCVYAKPCPSRAPGRGSLGLAERPGHTRSTNPTVCQLAHPPHSQREGQLCVLKKATTPCTKKRHSSCLGLGPGTEVYRRFIIFQKYSLNDRKLSQCHLYGGSLLLPIVVRFPSGLDVPRKERKEKQRETEDEGGRGESKSAPGLCHPCIQKTSSLLT